MLGFAPISTLPISCIPIAVAGGGTVTIAGAGAGRLTAHERRRRRVHAQQMAEWRREFQRLLDGADAVPAARVVAGAIARQLLDAEDPGTLARREFGQYFPADAALGMSIIYPTDRGEVARDIQQRRQIADVARRLGDIIAAERAMMEEDDDDVATILMGMW